MWRPDSARLPACLAAATLLAPRLACASIPFRQDNPGSALQLGLGYAGALGLLVLLTLALFMLRKRLVKRFPDLLSSRSGLQCVASLRMSMRTSVHVVCWRGREVMFAQCGEGLQLLSVFEAGRAPDEARP